MLLADILLGVKSSKRAHLAALRQPRAASLRASGPSHGRQLPWQSKASPGLGNQDSWEDHASLPCSSRAINTDLNVSLESSMGS